MPVVPSPHPPTKHALIVRVAVRHVGHLAVVFVLYALVSAALAVRIDTCRCAVTTMRAVHLRRRGRFHVITAGKSF